MQTDTSRNRPGIASVPTRRRDAPCSPRSADSPQDSGKSPNLQVLPAFAASFVVVHHIAVYGQFLRGADRYCADLDSALGCWGVCLFFALSGFLMSPRVARSTPLVFLTHRLSRIYPTYFAVVALSAAVFASLGIEFGGISVLALSLAPTGPRSFPLNVEWTLVLEVGFYIGLFLWASLGCAGCIARLAVGWMVLLAAAYFILPAGSRNIVPPPLYLVPVSAAAMPFAGGLLLPRLIAANWIGPRSAVLAVPFPAGCLFVDAASAFWLGGVAAVLLVGAAATGRPIRRHGAVATGLLALGDWSYVLYLVHVPVILLANRGCPPDWPAAAYVSMCAGGSIAATVLLGPLDSAVYRSLRARIHRMTPRRLRRLVRSFLVLFLGCAVWGSCETASNDWLEHRVRQALAALPADAWKARSRAATMIAEHGLASPSSLRGRIEATEQLSPIETMVNAFSFDPARPGLAMRLAIFCRGRLIAVDRPRRIRRDLAGLRGFETLDHQRIGYRVRLPVAACERAEMVAVVVDETARMLVLSDPEGEE